jgi:ferredoxin-nitrite reductase
VSDAVVARSAELNGVLPSRVNLAFGGSVRCREDAWLNDGAFVSVVRNGEPGYEVLAGGSLGKAPALAIPLADFVHRRDVVAAAEALIEVFVTHGDLDTPAKGRMKFVVEAMGAAAFRAAWDQAFAARRELPQREPAEVIVLPEPDRADVLRRVPDGGWSSGVRPQREGGRALLTVDLPMGDASSTELELVADLADRHADGYVTLGRDQDVILRDVDLDGIPRIRAALAERGLHLRGEGRTAQIRACTGSAVCALGVTTAPEAGRSLLTGPGLRRNSSLRVNVSGCPNSCAQHQAADIGLAGSKVRVGGLTRDGYQLYVGAQLDGPDPVVGSVVGRVAAEDVPAAVDAVVGAWEALRQGRESLGATVARVGHDAIAAHVAAVMDERWAEGAEPDPAATPVA